jgi:hypothetical protein
VIYWLFYFSIGLYLANLASKAIQSSASAQADFMSIIARVVILALAASIAIRYMGLANEIVNLAFGLIMGAIALAIAFEIGGRNVAARKLEEWTAAKK